MITCPYMLTIPHWSYIILTLSIIEEIDIDSMTGPVEEL
jgi:hypothetical protein